MEIQKVQIKFCVLDGKDLSQFQWKSAHAPKKELPKDFCDQIWRKSHNVFI